MTISNFGTETLECLVDVITRFSLSVPRARRGKLKLKEIDYLTMSFLYQEEPLIIGDMQRRLGILPGQMSRIINRLEKYESPLIDCRIHKDDKRKIEVFLTPAGRTAYEEHRTTRMAILSDILKGKIQ